MRKFYNCQDNIRRAPHNEGHNEHERRFYQKYIHPMVAGKWEGLLLCRFHRSVYEPAD